MSGGFTDVFSGNTIYPSDATYLGLTMSTDQTLEWPIEQQIGGNVVAAIVDVNATVAGLHIDLSSAKTISEGYTSLFNNVGANTVTIRDAAGGTIISLVPGTVWSIYLIDNTTDAGTWRVFQFGASVSTAVAAALAGAGLKAITTTLNEKMDISSKSSDYSILESDRANVLMWISGSGNFTLPDPTVVGSDWFVSVRNSGSGDLTVTPTSSSIDGASSKVFAPGQSCFIATDGLGYYTIGFGGSSTGSSFDYDAINISGSGDYVLSGTDLNRISYSLTGALTGDRNFIVPSTIQQYWITNSTTGAFNLTVKTASSPGLVVTQGTAAILYCNGSDIKIAQSTGTVFPIAIGDGGTGAATALGALANLGGTTIGIDIFTAADANAVLALINAVPASRTITASTGLTGGGDLSANRVFAVNVAANFAWSGNHTFTPASGVPVTITGPSAGTALLVTSATSNTEVDISSSLSPSGNVKLKLTAIDNTGFPISGYLTVANTTGSAMGIAALAAGGGGWVVDSTLGTVFITPNSGSNALSVSTNGGAGILVNGNTQDRFNKYRSSDLGRNTTTVLTDDTQLVINIPATALGKYRVRAFLLFNGTTTGTQGFQATLKYSGTFSNNYYAGYGSSNGAAVAITAAGAWGVNNVSAGTISTSSSNPDYFVLEGEIQATSTGNISIAWAQASSSGNNTNLLNGSSLIVERI